MLTAGRTWAGLGPAVQHVQSCAVAVSRCRRAAKPVAVRTSQTLAHASKARVLAAAPAPRPVAAVRPSNGGLCWDITGSAFSSDCRAMHSVATQSCMHTPTGLPVADGMQSDHSPVRSMGRSSCPRLVPSTPQRVVCVATNSNSSSRYSSVSSVWAPEVGSSMSLRGMHVTAAALNGEVEEAYRKAGEVALEEEMIMEPDEAQYWKDRVVMCRNVSQRQDAAHKIAKLDWTHKMGLSPVFASGERPNCWMEMMVSKVKHPYAISLVKIGKFYEVAGIDAIIMAEHLGLALMGKAEERVPKAGLPEGNLAKSLRVLVREQGFEVAVTEEVGDRGHLKQRQLVQLVTPENPQYLYKFAESGGSDVDLEAPAICGLTHTSRGYSVMAYNPGSNRIVLHEGLTLDAAWGHIFTDRSSKPIVYYHRPLDEPKPKEIVTAKKHLDGVIAYDYSAADPLTGFKAKLLQRKGLPAETELPVVPVSMPGPTSCLHVRFEGRSKGGFDWGKWGIHRVRAMYPSTAAQLGLLAAAFAGRLPSLLDAALPEGSRKFVRNMLGSLLMCPPPYGVAASTRQAVKQLMVLDQLLPQFCERGVTPQKVMVVLQREGNADFFQAFLGDLQHVEQVLQPKRSPKVAALVESVWPLLMHTTDRLTQQDQGDKGRLSQEQVLAAVQQAIISIQAVVAVPRTPGSSNGSAEASLDSSQGEGGGKAAPAKSGRGRSTAAPLVLTQRGAFQLAEGLMDDFSSVMEEWQSRVTPTAIKQSFDAEYHAAVDGFVATVAALLLAVHQQAAAAGVQLTATNCPTLAMDANNKTLRLKVPDNLKRKLVGVPLHLRYKLEHAVVDAPGQVLTAPDKSGRKKDVYSCAALDSALSRYSAAAEAANEAAAAALRQLSQDLSGTAAELAAAVQLGVLLVTLQEHSRAAKAAGWAVPLVGGKEQQAAGASSSQPHPEHDGVLQLRGLWPYWMSGSDVGTVKNDVQLDGFMLLTGPNMAGKSTVLRAVAAAALCGSVGLAIPAAAGSQLPLLDAIILRTFSGDAPQEGLSAYGVEMKEMATVLCDVQPRSLVLVDELGKGTEVVSGTALAAGILRELAAKQAIGVFATHLHLLVDLLKDTPGIADYRMEVVKAGAEAAAAAGTGQSPSDPASYLYSLRPTWRLLPGTCFESLAFAVARTCGVPETVLAAAAADYFAILAGGSKRPGYDAITRVARSSSAGQHSPPSSRSRSRGASSGRNSSSVCEEVGSRADSTDESREAQSGPPAAAASDAVLDSIGDSQQGFVSRSQARLAQLLQGGDSSAAEEAAARQAAGREVAHKLFAQLTVAVLAAPAAEATPAQESTAAEATPAQEMTATAAAAGAAAGVSKQGMGRRRRRGVSREEPQQQPVQPQQQQQQDVAAAAGVEGGVEYGVVHEAAPGSVPPPAHEGQSIVYLLQDPLGWWYAGETQSIRHRLKTHRQPAKFGKHLVAWYLLLQPGVDRKVTQGRLIKAADEMGLPMASVRDASMARKK